MKLRRTTDPAETAVSVAELKANSNITHDDDDARIVDIIKEATDGVESYSGRSLMPQTITAFYDAWPDMMSLPVIPIQGVSIKYTDDQGAEQALDPASYWLDAESFPAVITWADGAALPTLATGYNVIQVEIQAGYPAAGDVPAALKGALLMWGSHRYENAEATAPVDLKEVPLGAKAFMDAYRANF